MPPKIWLASIDTFEDLLDYVRNPMPIPFWTCNYHVDFHPPIPLRADESAFTQDNETVFTTTLFGKAAGPVTLLYGHRTFRIKFGPEGGDALHELYLSQFKPFGSDIIIAGSMIWILQTAKPRAWISPTESLLNRLIINSIQTGTMTVVCAGITIALLIHFTDKNYYYAFAYILEKLYSNSLMATLNYRTPRTHSQSYDHSIGMRIQVSHDTERWGDGLGHWHTAPDSRDDVAQKHASFTSNGARENIAVL
ncbi:hypothetical protein C8J57DRAFT_1588144 [Mycena rebaudengoi]|nr:hypothetical protein C8J57DRAFT_1588144 [Mycena rebaudengoi]